MEDYYIIQIKFNQKEFVSLQEYPIKTQAIRATNTLNGIEYSGFTTPMFESESSPSDDGKLVFAFFILGKCLCRWRRVLKLNLCIEKITYCFYNMKIT